MKPKYPRGSEWRKWDLHVHTPHTKLDNRYVVSADIDIWDEFCEKIERSDVDVIGITDYFSTDNYSTFLKHYQKKYPDSKKVFFLNIEVRLNESVNKALEEVNVHLLFNHCPLENVDKFLSKLNVVKTGIDERPITCSDLNTEADFKAASVTRQSIDEAFTETFGKKAIRQDHFLILTAANNDGIRPERGKQRKEAITDEIDKFSDGFFGGIQNQEYFLNIHRLEDEEQLIVKKPIVSGSDAHSFDELEKYLGKRVVEKDGEGKEIITKDITWIKADPTFEGLKQIFYEPEPCERVWIGPIEPDQKDGYRVIRKIKFNNTNDFPEEIEFNKNLCSIIGSRSSGKSALLAYIAHSIDKELTEKMIEGPGEGENYHWDKMDLEYSVEWDNGQSNNESPGKIVYIPQNYLFEKSKDPDEIKDKIAPVLFKVLPDFETRYTQTESNINTHNQQISEYVDEWFSLSDTIQSLDNTLKDLGDKKAVEKGKEELNSKIVKLKEENELSENDIKNCKKITADISAHKSRIKQIDTELLQISDVSTETTFFKTLKIMTSPALENLPRKLQNGIRQDLIKKELEIIAEANKQVVSYKESIKKEKTETEEKILKIKKDNSDLIEKYQKNTELEDLVHKINEHIATIKTIDDTVTEKKNIQSKLNEYEKSTKSEIDQRKSLLEQLTTNINNADQNSLKGIKFGIEYGYHESLEIVTQKINTRDKSEFIEKGSLKIKDIRENPVKFLSAIYSGKQKVNAGNDKKEVAKEILSLTEKILFTAEMEGDKIGGFSEPTMTPGKRALFALRLVLDESDDTWPLLIDQPEDDLDSRSVYTEIVPFLKEKKKERQIILVSHNANLVIGADSEQIIVANRNGDDRKNKDGKQFNYLTGSIEYTKEKVKDCEDTLDAQGIREHACEILDGGKTAFENRERKYGFKS
ncbi:MAG: hypothetical protein Q8N09_09615 [Thermodesulfovibrionia bacterium]|nr:hypothetical protein [Thermodesulfovibrionia bacterium]